MVVWLFHYVTGYLLLQISGDFNERLLNLFALNKVNVWNIKRVGERIFLSISVRDYKKIRNIRGKTKIKIRILKKIGVPFIVRRYRLRIGFLVGILLFFAIIYVLSQFVWRIEVVGNQHLTKNEILEMCDSVGLHIGAPKSKVDSYEIRDKMLLESNKLAWASFNLEGSVVTVNVSEIKNEFSDEEYCNIVSDYNGVIKSIIVQKGSAEVLSGEAVQKGDLLISGVVSATGHTYFTNATGTVTAEVEENIEIILPIEFTEKVKKGKTYKKYAFDFFSLAVPLFLGKENRQYNYNFNKYPLKLFDREMPIVLYELEISPYEPFLYKPSKEAVEIEVDRQLNFELKNKGIDKTNVINVAKIQNNTSYKYIFTVKYIKNIGIKEKLIF